MGCTKKWSKARSRRLRLAGPKPAWGKTSLSSSPRAQHQVGAGLGAHADPVDAGGTARVPLVSMATRTPRRCRASTSGVVELQQRLAAGAHHQRPGVDPGARRPRRDHGVGQRRRPWRSGPPPGPSVPTKSVSQNRHTAPARWRSWPLHRLQPANRQNTAGPPGVGPLALQREEELLDQVAHVSADPASTEGPGVGRARGRAQYCAGSWRPRPPGVGRRPPGATGPEWSAAEVGPVLRPPSSASSAVAQTGRRGMTPLELAAVAGAGVAAGAVNTIAGAGSLLTFPVLIAVGLPPLSANVTNDIGVIPGNASGAVGFRYELRGQAPRLARLLPLAAAGSLVGAVLLLAFSARTFELVAPVLLLVASAVTAAQPALARWVQRVARTRATVPCGW